MHNNTALVTACLPHHSAPSPCGRRECAPEVHAAVTAALQGAAEQPATAQVLVDCGSFWTLNRLLLREDLPADLKAQGSQVVAAVKQTLLAQSGERRRAGRLEWCAV